MTRQSHRARKREVLREIARLQKMALEGLAELDRLQRAPDASVVLEARIIDGEIIVDVE